MDTLALLREIKARMEREYVRPLSFDFVLKKIIEKEERKIRKEYTNFGVNGRNNKKSKRIELFYYN